MPGDNKSATTRSTPIKTGVSNPHFWIVTALTSGIIISYYADLLDLSNLPLPRWFFTMQYIHDLYRSLFLIPMLYAALVFRLRGAVILTLLFWVIVMPRGIFVSLNPDTLVTALAPGIFAGAATILLGLNQNRRLTEKRTLQNLNAAHEQLRSYLNQITRAQEEERKRLSHELHDETAQSLSILSLDIESLSFRMNELPSAEAVRRLEKIREGINGTIEGIRRFSHDLRPAALEYLGLLPALETLAADAAAYSKIDIKVSVIGNERRFSEEAELVLFRIAQESLRNVWRHSGATRADVIIEFGQGRTKLTVKDNGNGFNLPGTGKDFSIEGKFGLAGMQERAELVGGTLIVQSQTGLGTTISLEISA